MNILILASEDGESISNSSPISPVRWTQKNSLVNYSIASLAFVFMSTCIVLNRMNARNMIDSIVVDEGLKSAFENPDDKQEKVETSEVVDSAVKPTSEESKAVDKIKIDLEQKRKSDEDYNNDPDRAIFLDSFENKLLNGVDL